MRNSQYLASCHSSSGRLMPVSLYISVSMSVSMSHVCARGGVHARVHVQHGHGLLHAACCCISMSMLHAHIYAACPRPCCMSSACWMSTSVLHVLSTLHVHVQAASPCLCYVRVPVACTRPCGMSMSMLHTHICTCCTPMSMLHVHVQAASASPCSTEHGHGHAVGPWTCRRDVDIQLEHGHATWMLTCCMDIGMQLEHGYAAWTWACSMDLRGQWWLIGSSGGSLVTTPSCKPAVQGLNPAFSPAHSGLPILRWADIWDGISL